MKIKVCGMREKENVKALLELKPDFIGFNFYSHSPYFVERLPDVHWPAEVQKVGVFVNDPVERIIETALEHHIQVIQLHGNESAGDCERLQQQGFQIIKTFRIDESFDFFTLEPYKPFVNFFLFDTIEPLPGGAKSPFNWELLRQYDQQVPYFLGGGISLLHTEVVKSDWMSSFVPFAINVNSKFDQDEGVKQIDHLEKFIGALRN